MCPSGLSRTISSKTISRIQSVADRLDLRLLCFEHSRELSVACPDETFAMKLSASPTSSHENLMIREDLVDQLHAIHLSGSGVHIPPYKRQTPGFLGLTLSDFETCYCSYLLNIIPNKDKCHNREIEVLLRPN